MDKKNEEEEGIPLPELPDSLSPEKMAECLAAWADKVNADENTSPVLNQSSTPSEAQMKDTKTAHDLPSLDWESLLKDPVNHPVHKSSTKAVGEDVSPEEISAAWAGFVTPLPDPPPGTVEPPAVIISVPPHKLVGSETGKIATVSRRLRRRRRRTRLIIAGAILAAGVAALALIL